MCGIAGILNPAGGTSAEDVAPALHALRHRGPDGSGAWSDGHCTLGQRRLAIIDLSDAGRQPMANEDGAVQLTFNGEIYNFRELSHELTQLGHRFRSRTDSEVIIHAYEQWGPAAVARLRGMFAFAVWDQRRRRLLIARDRVGKKPLFYTQQNGRFLFASELQGLLAFPCVPRTVDPVAIDTYLACGYLPAPATGLRGIHKLTPGSWMTIDAADGCPRIHEERYWHLRYTPKTTLSERDAGAALRETLADAVRRRMISDVPIGAFLSGGIDSSIVVGLMARESAKVRTFSIGFREACYDETQYARAIATRWGTDHTEFVVEPDALQVLPDLVRHYGEPYADSSAIPTYYLSRLTRQSVTVALNGDGGDESFAGYDRYRAVRVGRWLDGVPGGRALVRGLSGMLPPARVSKATWARIRRFLDAAGLEPGRRYSRLLTFFDAASRAKLYTGDFARAAAAADADFLAELFERYADLDPVDAAMAVDVQSYLPFDLLVNVDITTMAHGLEGRSPFLDHEVMELAARLPVRYKLRGGEKKAILKREFQDLLPPEIRERPKMGFGVPLGEW